MADKLNQSAQEIHEHLIKKYNMKQVLFEMDTHKAKSYRTNSKLKRYFNSTPIRNAFARWMVHATYANRTYTITELVEEMGTNRQTVAGMVNDCEAEGWVQVKRFDNRVECKATSVLVKALEKYFQYRRNLIKGSVGEAFYDLYKFEKLMQKDFALAEDDTAHSLGLENVTLLS